MPVVSLIREYLAPASTITMAALTAVVCLAGSANAQTQIASRIDSAPPSHPLMSALKIGRSALAPLGNVSDYEEDRRERLGIEAERPHRITYKRLTRS